MSVDVFEINYVEAKNDLVKMLEEVLKEKFTYDVEAVIYRWLDRWIDIVSVEDSLDISTIDGPEDLKRYRKDVAAQALTTAAVLLGAHYAIGATEDGLPRFVLGKRFPIEKLTMSFFVLRRQPLGEEKYQPRDWLKLLMEENKI